jgi:hypothetical protein
VPEKMIGSILILSTDNLTISYNTRGKGKGKMPKPLTPTSSQEIIAISPPISFKSNYNDPGKSIRSKAIPFGKPTAPSPSQSKTISHMSNYASTSNPITSTSTTLPTPKTFQPSIELRGKIVEHVRADKYLQQIGHVPTPGDPSKLRITGEDGKGLKKGKRKEREDEVEKERKRLLGGDGDGSRERTTQRMVRSPSCIVISYLSPIGVYKEETLLMYRCRH